MRFPFKILILILFVFSLFKCQKTEEKKEVPPILKEYGKLDYIKDSLSVNLKLEKIKNFKTLVKSTENIVCNDSFPKLSFKRGEVIKSIYLHNPCWMNYGCILIKQKNVIEINSNSIIKNNIAYPLDSLETILKRDIENNGKNPELSDSIEKMLIYVSYENSEVEKFYEILDKLTEEYEKISKRRDINIWLLDTVKIISKPPPPEPVQKINIKK